MTSANEIRDAILADTTVSPACGLGIHLPDSLDGYYFWERWDRAKEPYRRENDHFAAALDELVNDNRLVRMTGRLDMYVSPSSFVDDENDLFVSEIDYLVFDEANRRHLKELYDQYRLKYIEPVDPGMEWYAPASVWADIVEGRVNDLVLDFRFSNNWDALVVGCDRVLELANSVGQSSHPLVANGFDHLISHVQSLSPGRNLPSRIRHVENKKSQTPWLMAIVVLVITLIAMMLAE